jgi:hypothetical protein
MSSYQAHILDQNNALIFAITDIELDEPVDVIPADPKLKSAICQPFEIPFASDEGPKAFFLAGEIKFSKVDDEVWFLQDGNPFFKAQLENETTIKLKLSDLSKMTH